MKVIPLVLLSALISGCAHLGRSGDDKAELRDLWTQAHQALALDQFAEAGTLFGRLAQEHPESEPGRESLFYLAAIRLDPRNPEWDPEPAERTLRRYVASDTATQVHRRPEALTLLRLAEQLNMPAEQRVPGLQPETRVVVRDAPRVITRAQESQALATEVARLKRELADRETKIAQQQEELERIRKTLTERRGRGD